MEVRFGVVHSFVQELGRQSDRRLIKLFTKNARLEIVGLGVVAQGKKELKEFFGYARMVKLSLAMLAPVVRGDTVFCRLVESNDWLHLVGVESMTYAVRFVFDGGKIDRIIVEPITGFGVTLQGPVFSFWKWLKSEEPDVIEELMPDGKFRFTPKNGRRLIELLSRWRGIN